MATFILKINGQEVESKNLPAGPVKDKFESLKTTFANQLGDSICAKHHQEPIVVFQSDGKDVRLMGISTCCRDFGATIRDLVKRTSEYKDSEWAVTSVYTERG